MDWSRQGGDWPNAAHSRFVDVKPHRWHVQEAGSGPTILLIHGAGGATQSWRGLFPLLAEDHHVIAPDLPGQGFTRLGARMRCGLKPMAEDLRRLCEAEGWEPDIIVGHSAGAAIALQMALADPPKGIVGINAALGSFEGIAGWLFPLLAKFMAINPLVPPLLARIAGGEARVGELLNSTGSRIDGEGRRLYRMLMTDSRHIDGALAMMAQWRIEPLLERLPEIAVPVLLIAATEDGTVPPDVSRRAAARLKNGELRVIDGLGHLAHEEAPQAIREAIAGFAESLDIRGAAHA